MDQCSRRKTKLLTVVIGAQQMSVTTENMLRDLVYCAEPRECVEIENGKLLGAKETTKACDLVYEW